MISSEPRSDIPRVTIGLPVYNGEAFVEAAIRSVLSQLFDDFKLHISDNASTDDTYEICRTMAAEDPRIVCTRWAENVGAARNFNVLVDHCQSPLFKWAAHDDLIRPSYLAACVRALDADPQAVLAHSRSEIIDSTGATVRPYVNRLDPERAYDSAHPHRRFGEMIRGVHACFEVFGVIRTDVLRQTSLIGSFTGSDRVLLAELALRGAFVEIPEPLFLSREHPARSIRSHDVDQLSGWFDPARERTISCPTWRLHAEYAKSIARAAPELTVGARAATLLGARVVRRTPDLTRDLAHAGRLIVQRRRRTD